MSKNTKSTMQETKSSAEEIAAEQLSSTTANTSETDPNITDAASIEKKRLADVATAKAAKEIAAREPTGMESAGLEGASESVKRQLRGTMDVRPIPRDQVNNSFGHPVDHDAIAASRAADSKTTTTRVLVRPEAEHPGCYSNGRFFRNGAHDYELTAEDVATINADELLGLRISIVDGSFELGDGGTQPPGSERAPERLKR